MQTKCNVACLCFVVLTNLVIFVFFIRMKSFQAHHFRLLHRRMGLVLNHFHCCCLDCCWRSPLQRLHLAIVIKLVIAVLVIVVLKQLILRWEMLIKQFLLAYKTLRLLQQIQIKNLLRSLHFYRKRSMLELRGFKRNQDFAIFELLPSLLVLL